MKDLYNYLNTISPIQENTWNEIKILFTAHSLKKGALFLKEGEVAKNFGFLKQGVIRAFYRNNNGVEYNKHFFTKNNMVDSL